MALMRARARTDRVRVVLVAVAAATAASYGAAAAAVVLALGRLGALPTASTGVASLLAAVIAAAAVFWRWRRVRRPEHVALWLEEKLPELQYALVTGLDPRFAGLAPELETQIGDTAFDRPAWDAARRALVPAMLALALGATALFATSRHEVVTVVRERVLPVAAGSSPDEPLSGIVVRLVLPAYAGGRAQELRDPETITGLTGSHVTVIGRTAADGIVARLGERFLPVGGRLWRVQFVMPAAPAALRLEDAGGAARVIVVQPAPDAPPRVQLTLPARDTLLRTPPASLGVRAELGDDIGLARAVIEYMISSGQEETFTARTGVAAARDFAGARTGQLSGTIAGAALRLGPGDVLSIRSVARDGNDVGGPGIGTSDTRTIRIARSDEYDSLAVEAMAPVFGDSALLSQRVILQRTEALVREAASLDRETLVQRASALALDQERLRNRVHSIVYPGHEHADESPMAGEPPDHAEPADPVNADLKIAYEGMWEAARELRIASPSTAVPPMRIAVEALDRARMADRRYLRGGTARIVVDLQRVRLTGLERGESASREPRAAADTALRELAARLAVIVAATNLSSEARANALSELRVELLLVNPRAAAALERAAASLRAGRPAAADLAAARTALSGTPVVREGFVPWGAW
ncbi:MAG TPA: hypothetical protein VMM17_05365 [Gemmatimonadaceae bacterium]|nr:hypothetical protein [Gemmatimonadaceae bacterium]